MPITSPFGPRSTALEVIAGHDLTGKTALVTGASSGIGVETVKALLSAGAEVIMAVRDTQKGEAVAEQLRTSTGNPHAHILELDLGSLASVRAAAHVLSRWPKLHILINNAGVMATPFSHTTDGFEMQFGTNHLGHFAFATSLLPALRAAAPSRIVVLSSIGHRRSDIHFEDPQYANRPYEKWEAYGQSKTANVLFAVGWNRLYGTEGITANALHPGGIQTGLQKFIPEEEQRAMGWIDEHGKVNPLFKSLEQGAATSIWAAVGQELEGVGGLYLEDCQEGLPFDAARPYSGYAPHARNPENAERLWQVSETLIGL
jgi:NAD(P)-dependent dehydrogenase (short-subunit alcohol dehydrogenase family)